MGKLFLILIIPLIVHAKIIIKSNYPLDKTNLEEILREENVEVIVELLKRIDRVKDVKLIESEEGKILYIDLFPVIEKIEIEGNSALWDSTIKEHTGLREGIPFKDMDEKIIEARIKHLYTEKGFLDASINVKIKNIKGRVYINIHVREGDLYFLYKPVFEGNKSIDGVTLRYISGLKVGSVFNPEDIQNATLSIHDFYIKKGFWDSFVYYKGLHKINIKYAFLQALYPGLERVKYKPITLFGVVFEGIGNLITHPIAVTKALFGKGKGVIASYRIIEGTRYDVIFRGNSFFKDEELKGLLTLQEKGVDIFSLEENKRLVEKKYKSKGFFDVKVKYRWERDGVNRIIYFIEEGERYRMKLITPQNEIDLPYIEFYDEDIIEKVERDIETSLKAEGYLLARIKRNISIDRKKHSVTVKLEVLNKNKLLLDKFVYTGDDEGIKDIFKRYNADLPAIYDSELIRKLELELEEFFRKKGYMEASFTTEAVTREEEDTIYYTYIYHINKGTRYTYGETLIYGYKRIKLFEIENMILRTKYFSEKNEDKTFRVFILSDIFSHVKMDYLIDRERKEVHRIIEFREKDRGFIDMSVGYNTQEGVTGEFRIGVRNITGLGTESSISYRRSNLYETYSINLKDNFLFSYRFTGDVSLFKGIRLHRSYDVESRGGSASLGYRIIPDIIIGITYSITQNRVFRQEEGIYDIEKVGLFFFRESRDRLFSPSKFHYTSLHIYRSINHPVYYRAEFLNFYMTQLTTTLSIDLKLALGYLDKGAPIFERFFLGGLKDLRGYAFEEIGQPSGGYYYAFGRFEFIFPIKGIVKGILFTDSGKVSNNIEEFRERFYTDAGFSVAIDTPVGPIRVDVAKPIDKLGDFTYSPIIYLYIGYAY